MSSGDSYRQILSSESAYSVARGHSKGTKRDWAQAKEKCWAEPCRLLDSPLHVCETRRTECAHVMGRRFDSHREDGVLWVNPDSVIPLCPNAHREYDAHRLDILPYLTLDEQADAVKRVGIIRAIARLTGARRPDWQSAGLVASQNPQGEEEA